MYCTSYSYDIDYDAVGGTCGLEDTWNMFLTAVIFYIKYEETSFLMKRWQQSC